MSYLARQAIDRAKQSLGVTEDRPYRNRGKWVDVYQQFVGILSKKAKDLMGKAGKPWCACFVAYKIHQAGRDLGVTPRWPKAPWSASCDAVYKWAKQNDLVLKQPTSECVFLVGTPADYTHMGFCDRVISRDGIQYVLTIEGNTNDEGHREGYEVCARTRMTKGLTFIRIV